MPPPPSSPPPLTEDRRKFLSALLDISVRQLAWPDDAEWEPPGGDEPDPDDDMAKFWQMRSVCTALPLLPTWKLTRSCVPGTARPSHHWTSRYIPRSLQTSLLLRLTPFRAVGHLQSPGNKPNSRCIWSTRLAS
jgi:hypothetical protein